MGYLIRQAVRRISGNQRGVLIFFLVLCVSIAPAMYVTGMLQQARYNMKMASYGTRDVSWIVEFYEQNISEEAVRSLFTDAFPDVEKCEFLANDRDIVYFGDKKVQTYVCGVSAGYFDMEGNSLVEGVNPWENGMYEGKCLLKEGVGLLQYGVEIGDRIRIGGQEYEVSGIIRIPYGYGTVYVPFDSFVFDRPGSFQCKTLISGAGKMTLNEWRQFVYQNTDTLIQVSDAGEIDRTYWESVVYNLRKRTDILSLTVVFALLGMIVTSMEKVYEDRYCIGVEMACGATVRQIFSEIMIQNLLIGMVAVLTDTALLTIVKHIFHIQIIRTPGAELLLIQYLVMEAVLLVVTVVCLFLILHGKTENVLLNEGQENIC